MKYNRVYLYAFNDLKHVVDAKYIREDRVSIMAMDSTAEYMFGGRPDITTIHAVIDRQGLKQDFLDTVIRPHFVKDIEFEDMIAKEAIRSWNR